MGILSTVLLVFFVIIAVLLVLLVLVQNEEGDSLGGIFAGGSSSAFGSRSGNVLTRTTTVLGALFLIVSLGLALLNRTPGGTGVIDAARELSSDAVGSDWWKPAQDDSNDALEDAFPNNGLENEAAQEPQPSPKGEGSPLDGSAVTE